MQIWLFCIWFDQEMHVVQNPHLDHTQSAPFAFRSAKHLGVYVTFIFIFTLFYLHIDMYFSDLFCNIVS